MRALVINLLLVLALPAIIAAPQVGVLAYYWVSYMAPHQIAWGGPAIPWAMVIALATTGAWLLSREPKWLPWTGVTVTLALFYLWTMMTGLFALHPEVAWGRAFDFTKVVIMAFVALGLMQSRARLHAFVWLIVIALGYYIVRGGIFVLVTGANYHVLGPPRSSFYQTNGMARAVIMTLPLMYYLCLHAAHRYVRIGLGVAVLLGVLALIGTNSRGGFLGFLAMLGFVWLHSRYKLRGLVVAAALAGIGLAVLPEQRLAGWTDRIETIEAYEADTSAQGRFKAWGYAIDIASRNPLTGGGFGAFLGNTQLDGTGHHEAHSNYFEVLGEHGFVGLALYLLLAVLVFRTGSRIRRRTRGRPDLYWARDLALMVQVALVGYFVGGLTINDAFLELYYSLVAIMVLTGLQVDRALAGEAAPAPPRAAPAPARLRWRWRPP